MRTDDKTDEEIISGCLAHHATGDDEKYFWAVEATIYLARENPQRLWLITLEMIRRTADDSTLGWIAAGPLEDLLDYHGNEFIERAENLARTDPRFRLALTGVWLLKGDIQERVQKACADSPRLHG